MNPPNRPSNGSEPQLRLLLSAAQAISAATDLDAALAGVIEHLCAATGWEYGESWLLRDGRLEAGPAWHAPLEELAAFRALRREALHSAAGALPWFTSEARAVSWDEGLRDEASSCAGMARALFRTAVALPILAGSTPVGALVFYLREAPAEEHRSAAALVGVVAAHLGEWVMRKRSEDLVRASEERLRILVEHIGDAVFFLDRDGRVQSWTPSAHRLLGYTPAEVLGRDADLFSSASRRVGGGLQAHLRGAESSGCFTDEDVRIRKDGTAFWAHVTTCAVRDTNGRVSGFATVIRDLTAEHEAQEAQARYVRTLELANRDLEQYATVASHDLQEPVRKILTFADRIQLRSAGALDEQARDYLSRLQHAARRMQALLADLLAYARMTGRGRVERVDLGAIARDVLGDLDVQLERTGGAVDVGPLPSIEGDPTQLRQVFQNLVSNALKFQPTGGSPRVRISASPLPDRFDPARGEWVGLWELRFEDNGIGFEPRLAGKVFEMLKRLHPRGAYEGSGMGLAICQRIVQQHDGTITAHSTPGRGSTFVVTLPGTQPRGREP